MSKIVFIGAGSMMFTRNLVRDILSFPVFSGDLDIALVDTDQQNLDYSRAVVERIIREGHYGATLTATTRREEVLEGADGVLITIAVGGDEATLVDVGIPEKYGVSVCVGDTRGPQGIFRYLRTIPVIMEIIRDIEKYCPQALVLNYTNPMGMICRTVQQLSPVLITGLCHSVQHTAEMLGGWIGAPREEISYLCAGINHQAHYLSFKWKGKDAYPLIRDRILGDKAIYDSEKVRNELFLHLGYYVTESTVHNSEYNPWFRKRPDLITRYLPEDSTRTTERIRGWIEASAQKRKTEIEQWLAEPLDLNRGREYAASIFNAVFGDGTIFEFNGNIRNFGIIDNLPPGSCVESPVEASRAGLRSIHVGALPPQLAILNGVNAQIEDLAVEGYICRDREKIYYANYHDPLTSAMLSLEEIRKMTDEMFSAGGKWLPL
jgi:alpha-galactosidase